MEVLNPSTGEVMAEVPRGTADDVERAVEAAKQAWDGWREKTPKDRMELLLKLADVIDENAEELARLYRGARCVAYVSLYEGFGLPVLEAMACGAPVVTSTAPALVEVGGDVAVAVDGLDAGAIAGGLEEAAARRAALGPRGIERARRFGWDEAARATISVYRSVAR